MTWHITNIRDANWYQEGPFGVSGNFQRDERFDEFGFNFGVVWPGQPLAMYHREANQEGFLVLAGECLAVVEGEEHPLRQWDYLHCPPGTDHVIVGAGDGPAFLIAVGGRTGEKGIVYPVDPVALAHNAGVEQETTVPQEAYAPFPDAVPTAFSEDYLPRVSPPTAPGSSR
jgi:uncharacterized cupin superfamily protein